METIRPRLSKTRYESYLKWLDSQEESGESRVLAIGDLHEPFCLDEYLDFCIEVYAEYQCNEVVFIGDIIDNHYSSYHEADPDGMGAGDELEHAINRIKRWHEAFPNAKWVMGNHDRLVHRKAVTAGLSKRWIRDYTDVLECPTWKMGASFNIDGVQYIHGEGGTARNRARNDLTSTVQGHLHTKAYTHFWVGKTFKIFGMQTGCGVDHKSYALAYAKDHKKPAIGCGVIINGKQPINVMMEL